MRWHKGFAPKARERPEDVYQAAIAAGRVSEMADMMHNPIVLPPLITSPQSGPQRGLMTLESIAQTHHNGQHSANAGWPQQTPAEISTSCPQPSLGHVPASAGSCPADIRAQAAPSPARAGGKSPDQRSPQDKRMELKIEQSAAGGDDIITLFPRRKAGQSRPGGGRGPVVLNLELLEQFYGMPLHVAAKRLVSSSGAVCLSL